MLYCHSLKMKDFVMYLLEHGADANIGNVGGKDNLTLAEEYGYADEFEVARDLHASPGFFPK
jgi:ankyrin repeat protein